MGKSIFELTDKFGYNSPWKENWKEAFSKNQHEVAKITNAYVEKDLFRQALMDTLQKEKYTNSFSVVIPISVIINIEGYPDKVEVELDGKKRSAYRDSTFPYLKYRALFDIAFTRLLYKQKEFPCKITVTDIYTKKVSDTKNISVTVYSNGGIKNSAINSNAIPVNYSIQTIEFHVYANHEIEKWMPKDYDKKAQKGKIKYVYHDIQGNQYDITEVDFHYAQKRKNGAAITEIPSGYIDTYDYPEGGNAQRAYVYDNGDIHVDGTKYGKRKYPQDNGFVQLIRMPDDIKIKESNFSIDYKFINSERKYCNPESFAGFIGTLAEISKPVVCTGMCFADATSYPSVTHPNGDSADTGYFSTLGEEQRKVDAFHNFHFVNIYRGKNNWYPKLKGTKYSSGHEDHLHAGDFDSNVVKLKIIE